MFCSECGQQNEADAKFCTNCGNKFLSATKAPSSSAGPSSSAQPSAPSPAIAYVHTELKDSGTVTAMSVIGFVFGLIGMMGSFIPCIGSLAFYIGIPAALISAIALGIAYSQNAKKTFAVVAVTISLIGVVISGWQYFSIISAGKNADRELKRMLGRGQQHSERRETPAPSPAPPPLQKEHNEVAAIINGEKISIAEVDQKFDLYKKMSGKGGQPDSTTPEGKAAAADLRKQILNAMIQEKIFITEAAKENINVSKNEITDKIIAAKKQINILSDREFEEFLKSKGMSSSDFENRVKKDITIVKIIAKGTEKYGLTKEAWVNKLNARAKVERFDSGNQE